MGSCSVEVIHIVVPSLVRAKANGGWGGNSGFELSLFIQHIDLMDSHARDAPLPPSAASVSDAIEALNGTECHRGGRKKKALLIPTLCN